MNHAFTVLAFDIGSGLFILFALISLVSWIRNQANAGQAGAPPRRPVPPGPQRNPQIQREIDRFLREAAAQANKPVVKADEIEIVEGPSGRRPPARRKVVEKPRPAQAAARPPAKRRSGLAASPQRPGQDLANRHLALAPQSAVASEHLPPGVAAEHLARNVDKAVVAHLGTFAAADSRKTRGPQGARPTTFLAELRTPRGVRTAIIMQEILQRPRALRRRAT